MTTGEMVFVTGSILLALVFMVRAARGPMPRGQKKEHEEPQLPLSFLMVTSIALLVLGLILLVKKMNWVSDAMALLWVAWHLIMRAGRSYTRIAVSVLLPLGGAAVLLGTPTELKPVAGHLSLIASVLVFTASQWREPASKGLLWLFVFGIAAWLLGHPTTAVYLSAFGLIPLGIWTIRRAARLNG